MKKIAAGFLLCFFAFAAEAADIKGKWLTEEGKANVVMESCGASVCGKIVWLKDPNDPSGKPLVDALNQDESMRTRPIIGLKLTEVTPGGDNVWKGKIYNPEDGKTYAGELKIQPDGSLLVKGCVLGGMLCDDETWTRAN